MEADPEFLTNATELYEGAVMQVMVNKYERNREARDLCLKKKGYQCIVCEMDFEKMYGEIGREFIHVHHTKPIASIGKDYQIDPEKDLVPVCPNCHAMLHRRTPPYSVEELKKMIK